MSNRQYKNDNLPCAALMIVNSDFQPYGLKTAYEGWPITQFMIDMKPAHFQKIIDKSDGNIKMFGTAEEFFKAAKRYQNFLGDHLWFGHNMTEPYSITSTATIHITSKKTQIIRRFDHYSMMQSSLFLHVAPGPENRILRAMITLLLKSEESTHKNGHEFVFYGSSFPDIDKEVRQLAEIILDDERNERIGTVYSCERLYISRLFRGMMPSVNWGASEISTMQQFQNRYFTEDSRNSSDGHFNKIVYKLKTIEAFLSEWFKKIRKLPGPANVVQIIRDGERSYVLEDELVLAAKGSVRPGRILRTLPKEKIAILKGVEEVIETELVRTKNHVQPLLITTGRFYKTAIDVLHQVLQGCYFGFRVFQKLKKNEWEEVERFFNELKPFFDQEKKYVYFLDKSAIGAIKRATEKYFDHLESRSAKDVRIPNKLTVESVKKELVYLGITAIFPDSVSYAEESVKTEEAHETVDIFDAIRHCLTESLLKRIPWLALFCNNQKEAFKCLEATEESASTQSTKRFSKSCWKDVELSSEMLGTCSAAILNTKSCDMFYNNCAQELVASNYCMKPCYSELTRENMKEKFLGRQKDWKPEVFLIDREEIETRKQKCGKRRDPKDLQNALETYQEFLNLEAYSKLNPKRVYLRTFSSSVNNRKEDRKVFAVEVFEAIPILLEQQGDQVDQEKLEKYREKYRWIDENVTMTLTQLEEILEDFDVNKELLALVPDISHALSSFINMKVMSGIPIATFPNPQWIPVMEASMAKFHIFQSVVCDVEWTKEVINDPKNSKEDFKEMVIEWMKRMGNEGVITVEAVEAVIRALKAHPNYEERMERKILTPLIKLFDARFGDTISFAFFQSECHSAGIECRRPDRTTKKNLEDTQLPVWKARLLFLNAWIEKFFAGTMEDDLERSVRMGLLQKVPIFEWKLDTDFMDLIFLDNKNNRRWDLLNDLKKFELAALDVTQEYYNHSWLENTSYSDRDYIERCQTWKFQDDFDDYVRARSASQKMIEENYGERDADENKMLRGMIGTQNGIKSWVKELFRTENAKFYGSCGSTPQEIARTKELRNGLRCVMDKIEKKRQTDSEDEESEDEEALEHLEEIQRVFPTEHRAEKIQRLKEKRENMYPRLPFAEEDSGAAGSSVEGSDEDVITMEQLIFGEKLERINRALDREWDEMEQDALDDLDEEESDESETENVEAQNGVSAAVEQRIAELEAELKRSNQRGPSSSAILERPPSESKNRNSRQKEKEQKKAGKPEVSESPSTSSGLPGPSSSANSNNPQQQEEKSETQKTQEAPRASESPATSRSENGSLPRSSAKAVVQPKNPPAPQKGIDPRESKNCTKCFDTSQRCIEKDKEVTLANNKIRRVQKDMARIQREADSEIQAKQREWEVERAKYEAQLREKDELLRETKDQLDMMTRRVDTIRMSNTQLTQQNAELKASNAYQHQAIQLLRGQVHPETVLALKIRPSFEMRKILIDLQHKQDRIKSGELNRDAEKKVYTEFFGLTEESELREFAKWHLKNFQMEMTEYERIVIGNIELIQATPLITPAELSPVPAEPNLSQIFHTKLRQLHAIRNNEIEEQCAVCWYQAGEQVEVDQGGWTQCTVCSKKFHKVCVENWYRNRERRDCPHCTLITDIPL